ncbi:D-amino acid aminotransferase [Porcipelethomonas sp.]|uniref:D-amino acid aminotransferase n=1 Tax=Porcipelethomonas sp. TaxID=2981675 RepID=UPI003EF546F8
MKNLGYYNGRIGLIEEMMIPMTDRVCFFGDGVYDATYARNHKIFAIEDHLDRFYNSAKFLKIEIPVKREELKAALEEMVNKVDDGEQFVYWQVTRGNKGLRNHAFPDSEDKASLWITIEPRKIVDIHKKVRLITMEDVRFLMCNIKTLNLIPSVMAAQATKEAGCDECIFHRNGRVTECAHSNVSIIRDGKFITAPTDNLILPGISRKHILQFCREFGIPVLEQPYTLDDLMNADEVVVTSSGQLCLQAIEVDGKPVGGKAPEILQKLQDAYLEKFMKETD